MSHDKPYNGWEGDERIREPSPGYKTARRFATDNYPFSTRQTLVEDVRDHANIGVDIRGHDERGVNLRDPMFRQCTP
jgi:hypothetical protein